MIKFVITLLVIAVMLSAVAVGWPKLTSQPRPVALARVNDFVKDTSVGKNIALALGITDQSIEPINVASVASSLAQGIAKAAAGRAQHIVVTQAVRQLASQFDALSKSDKEQIQGLICTNE